MKFPWYQEESLLQSSASKLHDRGPNHSRRGRVSAGALSRGNT
jgi:hypothetical protein